MRVKSSEKKISSSIEKSKDIYKNMFIIQSNLAKNSTIEFQKQANALHSYIGVHGKKEKKKRNYSFRSSFSVSPFCVFSRCCEASRENNREDRNFSNSGCCCKHVGTAVS